MVPGEAYPRGGLPIRLVYVILSFLRAGVGEPWVGNWTERSTDTDKRPTHPLRQAGWLEKRKRRTSGRVLGM